MKDILTAFIFGAILSPAFVGALHFIWERLTTTKDERIINWINEKGYHAK